EGRVIGLQSRAAVRGADLIVPIETLREVAAELAAHGRVRSGFLGVSVRPIGLPDAARRQLSRRRGALVMGVAPGGPAES
ncbi:MAG TPA: signal protein PDZ, partial [Myxococcales bacterium]|nr:signal protein PDZ [Myxococcales bacterium]